MKIVTNRTQYEDNQHLHRIPKYGELLTAFAKIAESQTAQTNVYFRFLMD